MQAAQSSFDPANFAQHYKAVRSRLFAPPKSRVIELPPVEAAPPPPAEVMPPPTANTSKATAKPAPAFKNSIIFEDPTGKPVTRYVHPIGPGILFYHPVFEKRATVSLILHDVAQASGISVDAILGYQRLVPIVRARHAAMYAIKKELNLSLPRIGTIFHRDHTSVLHGIRRHAERLISGEAA